VETQQEATRNTTRATAATVLASTQGDQGDADRCDASSFLHAPI
jgi:hypothetical protein